MADPVADLEIALHRRESEGYTAELRYTAPDSDAEVRPGAPGVVRFDWAALRAAEPDPAAYGAQLSESLYAAPAFRQAVAETMASAAGQDAILRVRLAIGPSAPELHALRWELLRDPAGQPLLLGQQVRFSRYLASRDWRPVRLRARADLRALVAVAAPPNLAAFNLAPIDAPAELARAQAALGAVPVAALSGEGQVTLDAIISALRDGHAGSENFDILYLVAHGALVDGEPYLWLDAAEQRPTPGAELVQQISELRRRPRLVVLASCESAGEGLTADGAPLAALGPRLAEAGIPAVIAMQGKVSLETAGAFMAAFFAQLSSEGAIDGAMAVARGSVRARDDHWMPVLFMRLRSGQIWYDPGFGGDRPFEQWPKITRNIGAGNCTPVIGPGLAESIIGSPREVAGRWAAQYNFPLAPHQREDLASVAQFLSVNQEPQFPRYELLSYLRGELIARYGKHFPGDLSQAPLPEVFAAVSAALRARGQHDPHQVLAELPFAVYVTTAIDTLLEEALRAAKREPQVELLRWNEYLVDLPSLFDEGSDYKPSKERPLVFHLFGSVENEDSLVLTEDDYFDYLIGATRNRELIPPAVRAALVDRALLFLGFRLDDWSFRVLFRSLMSDEGGNRRKRYTNIAGQIVPEEGQVLSPGGVSRYMERYFRDVNIDLFWGGADDFTRQLQKEWQKSGGR